MHYEDRWGPLRAVLFRLIIPVGLLGSLPLLLIAAMLLHTMTLLIVAYPVVVVLVAFCSVRNVILAQGAVARVLGSVVGALLTGVVAILAFRLFIASGGV
ncbi:hypothetical protein [Caulobacter sp. S45]|uniref:hypothetical protein n=1 Tax=Caulobacter sp. S45 TaxID=1641861 RepID=UPI001C2045E1|nr:hypothetical protein [Caulobacter sp. S45]